MASDEKNIVPTQSSQNLPTQPEGLTTGKEKRQELSLYRKPQFPLPGNRPIADNTTDGPDELMGYLD